ncbi:MAG: protein kinase, partial [Deltaproteobacteria bacterium]|nr:protein kinase [Deltaproteobacteria bacterium]
MRHLASGGMAEVWLARVTGGDAVGGFERHVVVKCIRGEGADSPELVEMFVEEARLAASLHHSNVVQVHDIGVDRGRHYFAMEYVHGEDLRRLLAHAAGTSVPIPIDHAVAIVIGAAAGLHHAHEHPRAIVHRDVSPANILVGYDGSVKVVDFGIAKAAHRACETRSGLMKGKVAYMSPEQCVGHAVDRRSDVFCLGIVLYELLAARRLFKGANDFLTMSAITSGAIPPLAAHRPGVPAELAAVVARALAHAPTDRHATADELRLDLERVAARLGLRTGPSALADYLRATLGDRPVPWLLADDDPEIEVVADDFDGGGLDGMVAAPVVASASGDGVSARHRLPRASTDFDGDVAGLAIAPVPAFSFAVPDARPSSPIMRARSKAITNAPLPIDASGADTQRVAVPPSTAMPPAMPRPLMALGGIPVALATPPSSPVLIGGIPVLTTDAPTPYRRARLGSTPPPSDDADGVVVTAAPVPVKVIAPPVRRP